jgi:hypothetical protein
MAPVVPEFWVVNPVDSGVGGHQILEDDWKPRLGLNKLPYPTVDIDVPLAHVDPPHGNAFRHLPDGAVAHVARLRVGNQHLERHMRIFEHPDGVTRVEAHAHDIPADGVDHHLHLARLQIAAVVLHRQLHSRIDDSRSHAAGVHAGVLVLLLAAGCGGEEPTSPSGAGRMEISRLTTGARRGRRWWSARDGSTMA